MPFFDCQHRPKAIDITGFPTFSPFNIRRLFLLISIAF